MKKDIRMMKAVAAAVLGNSFFGLSFLFSKVALERLEPFVLLAVRFIVAFVMLNLVLLTGKVKIRLTGKPVQKILMLGLVQPVLYFYIRKLWDSGDVYGICGNTASHCAGDHADCGSSLQKRNSIKAAGLWGGAFRDWSCGDKSGSAERKQ